MRGKRKDTHDVLHQGYEAINNMYARGRGTSKHTDKQTSRGFDGKIYSAETHKDYARKWRYYCDSMKGAGYTVNGHKPRTLEEAAGYMPQYIRELEARQGSRPGSHMSAWSIRSYFSAAAKVLGISAKDFPLPERKREDITRSRSPAVRDSHFSTERNAALISFASCTGLRNKKELQQIRGTDLIQRNDGSYSISVTGKGGKYRESIIYGQPEEVREVVARMKAAGPALVWPNVHTAADIHACRAEYASRMYDAIARDPATLPMNERYCCRGDMAGLWFDKAALMEVSRQLGHARCNVIVSHYLWKRGNGS